MKVKSLIIISLIVIINIMFSCINMVQAAGIGDVITGGDNFMQAGNSGEIGIDHSKLQDTSKTINNILIIVGMCVAVVISSVLGIKFMLGSVDEKAQVKDALVPFVIGCMVVFGAFGIWRIFINIGYKL
ncbi:MAG: hypothetical protein HFJ60_02500 [Clostridia bacterium]|jgi:hypothetical protein|nr:hypothetical protein [Clostridia bacterium]